MNCIVLCTFSPDFKNRKKCEKPNGLWDTIPVDQSDNQHNRICKTLQLLHRWLLRPNPCRGERGIFWCCHNHGGGFLWKTIWNTAHGIMHCCFKRRGITGGPCPVEPSSEV